MDRRSASTSSTNSPGYDAVCDQKFCFSVGHQIKSRNIHGCNNLGVKGLSHGSFISEMFGKGSK